MFMSDGAAEFDLQAPIESPFESPAQSKLVRLAPRRSKASKKNALRGNAFCSLLVSIKVSRSR